MRAAARVFLIGGVMSYRAMFTWLNPWILAPTMVVAPTCQVLLFAFVGRSAGVGDDRFYVIGNAINYAAIPCLFAMSSVIDGERIANTLGIIFTTPAARVPLFLGRALPVVVNGWLVAMFAFFAGSALLHVHVSPEALPAILVTVAVSVASCTGLGLVMGAIALRLRESAVIGNLLFCVLLVFTGANVDRDRLPAWMADLGAWMPLSHGIAACRQVAVGASLAEVRWQLLAEASVGLLYTLLGMLMLRWLEQLSRRSATLERS